jgi:hypothetical protein
MRIRKKEYAQKKKLQANHISINIEHSSKEYLGFGARN